MNELNMFLVWVWETFGPFLMGSVVIGVASLLLNIFLQITDRRNLESDWPRAVEQNDWDDPEMMAYLRRPQPRSRKTRAIIRTKTNRKKI